MLTCETCGNEYEDCMRIEIKGRSYTFDSFECAIEKLAPRCAHCGVKVIGHGVQTPGQIFCGAHCARIDGYREVVDRAVNHVQ